MAPRRNASPPLKGGPASAWDRNAWFSPISQTFGDKDPGVRRYRLSSEPRLLGPAVPDDNVVAAEQLIVTVRGRRVMLSGDLARIYGVQPHVLNQAVKRHPERSPADFVIRVTREEALAIRRSRSQSVILKRGENVKYLPWAFTEHGAVMAATVLNSPRAVQMSIFVVRAFLRLREWASGQAECGR